VDELQCTGFLNNGAVIEDEETGIKPNYQNLKTQCYFALADAIGNGVMTLKVNPMS
jgi:hypothetical protein